MHSDTALKYKQYNPIYTFSMALPWCIFPLSFLGTHFTFVMFIWFFFFFFLKSSKCITASVLSTKCNPTETSFNKHCTRSFSAINKAHHKHIGLLLCYPYEPSWHLTSTGHLCSLVIDHKRPTHFLVQYPTFLVPILFLVI